MTGRLAGKSALVTGGASGFGAAIARSFAREGARVTIMDLDEAGAARVVGEIGEAAASIRGDVTSRADFDGAIAHAAGHGGQLDILVNNAGWTHRNKPLEEVSEEEFDRVYSINVKSIYHSVQASLPVFTAQGAGVMINIGSTAGIRPRPGLTWYNGSKGAVNILTRSLAAELAPRGIRVNGVAPVMGATALLESFMGLPDTPENRAKFIATVPLGRLSEPEDVAGACLYLASDEAAFVTGVILEVDGGRTI
ncbi:glucose 1-dehydrogenase [Antarcticirhabdus aurantiaca]|uniref:Glucose 1-dehydrogenase n=1 Tax=Antarcticirhabdus aurantiaca TaxID=2606717 RepID=A0ACD4NS74_9HYPH|nr:glucose 1-dehydrogenase [Antarcticirhabdus aurantiaca]WAJ29632.1 glucose 1-dehydrogenase [Jeongeuplla avenae]